MFDDVGISEAILDSYNKKLRECLRNDVVIVGAGPSGLTAAFYLARRGVKTVVVEKKLAPGGGIWGGGMGMNDVVFQAEALPILKDMGVRAERKHGELHVVDAVELASALCLKALHAGATILNLTTVEDLCLQDGGVTGVVVNRTGISGVYHVDPIVLVAKAVLDGTGHDAGMVHFLMKRGLLKNLTAEKPAVEAPMHAPTGEAFVVEHTGEVFPGLWLSGMSVCSAYGGPRMGPIFGGMLLSGKKAAEMIYARLKK
jgi:thiamine thiazole synthase